MELVPTTSQKAETPVGDHRTTDCYRFLPLEHGSEIRVLDIVQSTDGAGQPIVAGTLRIVDLDKSPAFSALSYVWGKYSTPKDVLHCNGSQIEVTRSCWSAMYHLTKSGPLTIWIDAICINQADRGEKARQIPLMARIYSSAQVTYAWLRDSNPEIDEAMDFIAKGGLPFDRFVPARVSSNPNIPTGNGMVFRLALHLYAQLVIRRIKPHYGGLGAIWGALWIERLWTLQEAVLSNNLLIVCGEKSVSWGAVAHSLEYMALFDQKFLAFHFPSTLGPWWLLTTLWRDHRGHRAEALGVELEQHKSYLKRAYQGFIGVVICNLILSPTLIIAGIARSAHTEQAAPLIVIGLFIAAPLFGLVVSVVFRNLESRVFPFSSTEAFLLELWRRQATNAEDKYFGVLCFQGDGQEEATPAPIGAPLDVIFTLLFGHIVRCAQSLDVLLFAGHGLRMGSTASWVVDWRSCDGIWLTALFHAGSNSLSSSFWRKYLPSSKLVGRYPGATPGSSPHCDIDMGTGELSSGRGSNTPVLKARGHIVGRITFSSRELKEMHAASASQQQLLKIVDDFLKVSHGIEHQDLEYAMRRLWQLDSNDDGFDYTATGLWLTLMERGVREGPEWTLHQLQTSKMPRYDIGLETHISLVNCLAQQRMALVRCEGIILNALGTAPCDVMEGDVVALLAGVSLPIVLRELKGQDRYEVVGPSFIPATLEGHIWRNLNPDSLEMIELV